MCHLQDWPIELLPVDWAAAKIVAIALAPSTRNRTLHVALPRERCPTLRDAAEWLRASGHVLEMVDAAEWVRAVEASPALMLARALQATGQVCSCRGAQSTLA